MADFFLIKSPLALEACLSHDGALVLEQYAALQEVLEAHAPGSVGLFAEPLISRGNDRAAASVSWYGDVDGKPIALDRLDAAARAEAEVALHAQVAPLMPLLDDPDVGALLSRALYTLDAGSVVSVSGTPILLNWGMLPDGLERDRSARSAHFARTLGAHVDFPASPPLGPSEARSYRAGLSDEGTADAVPGAARATGAAAAAATASAGLASAAAAQTSSKPTGTENGAGPASPPAGGAGSESGRRRVGPGAWVPLLVLTLLAALVLVWLVLPGTRLFPEDHADQAVSDASAVALAEEVNAALEARLATLQVALDGAQCRADGTLLMPDGLTIEGLLPPDPRDPSDRAGAIVPADLTPILPPDPARIAVPGSAGNLDTANLLSLIDARTALVVASTPNGTGTGTGFFVGPDLLVTNYHVIEGAAPDSIFVTNRALGAIQPAQLLKQSGPLQSTGADFALLRVAGANQPSFDIFQGSESLRLQAVIAAGYPGDILRTDVQFSQLREGDLSAVPQLAVTDGTVSVEQSMAPRDTRVVVHSAPISTGNSGGPLIDTCGRLVGVNTFVVQGPLRNLNFALASAELLAFLQGSGALPNVVSGPCRPQVARPEAPPMVASVPAPDLVPGTVPAPDLAVPLIPALPIPDGAAE